MKLFISWSGERSRLLAEGLSVWLPGVINAIEPWVSSTEIEPGSRWSAEIANELDQTKYGIICVTSDNINAPWLLFEAGALSKSVQQSRVVPLLLDIKPTDLKAPLSQFQALQATEVNIKKLIKGINLTINESGEKGMRESLLDQTFQLWWPQLKIAIEKIPPVINNTKPNERTEKELLEELLLLVRRIDRRQPSPSSSMSPSVNRFPTPPENFPEGWDSEWQPSFHDPQYNDPEEKVVPNQVKRESPPRKKS